MTMPTFLQPPKPGRPKRNPIDVLRTKVWFYAVKARSGLPSAYAIELAIEPSIVKHKEAGVVRPRKWDGYQTGLRVPQRMVGKPYSVVIADQNYPGTASYFDSPIWAVLRGDQLNQRWIDDNLKALAPAITDLLMVSAPPMLQAIPQPDRFQKFDEETAYRLAEIGTFEALVALILLVKKSEQISSQELRELALNAYHHCQSWVKVLPEIAPIALDLFHEIDLKCKHWIYPSPEWRMEVVIFSREINR